MSNINKSYSSIPVQTNGLITKQFSITQKQNISIDNFKIEDINLNMTDIIKKVLKAYNDASLNNVDISNNLISRNIYVDDYITFY